tara:strand:+ start:554 stop:1732 length:1179 start_codon:yes stop_codon:yes gene_type:complete
MARQEEMLLNAAAKAASQETIGSFLNSLPNYLLQQQQYKDSIEREDERYADSLDFRNTQYADTLRVQEEQSDLSFLNIGLGLEDPDEQKTYFETYAPKSARGENAFEAAKKTVAVRNTNKSNISVAFKDLEKNKNEMTFEEYSAELSRIETMSASNSNLQRTFKPIFDRYKVLGEKKRNKELAKELLDIDAYGFSDEQKKEVEEAIALSDNPTKVLSDLATRIQSDKLTTDQLSKLGNTAAALRNAGEDTLADIIGQKIQKSEGFESVDDFGLTDAQAQALRDQGNPNEFIKEVENDFGETTRYYYNLDEKTFREVDDTFKLEPQSEEDSSGGGFFSGFGLKGSRAMPESQRRTNLNIINNENIPPSAASYKRAYNRLEQAGLLPDNARQPE